MKLSADNSFAARATLRRRVTVSSPPELFFRCDGGEMIWDAENVSPQVTPRPSWANYPPTGMDLEQATVASQPAWSISTGWRGNGPGTTFDGVDDFMTLASTTGLPTGSSAGEIWLMVDQATTAATTDDLTIFGYGGTTAGTHRSVQRVVVDGVNRVRVTDGTVSVTDAEMDFSGPHYVRAWWDGTTMGLSVDGRAVGTAALVPATGTAIVSMAKATSGSGATWGGTIMQAMIGTGNCSAPYIEGNELFGTSKR